MSFDKSSASMLFCSLSCCGALGNSSHAQTFKLCCCLMSHQAALLVHDDLERWAKHVDPGLEDAGQQLITFLSFHHTAHLEARCFIQHDQKPGAIHVEEVDLDCFIKDMSSSSSGLWSIWQPDVFATHCTSCHSFSCLFKNFSWHSSTSKKTDKV